MMSAHTDGVVVTSSNGLGRVHCKTFARLRQVLSLPGIVVLCGCAVGPDYKRPPMPAPQSFSAQAAEGGATFDTKSDPSPALAEWWKGFGDNELDQLVVRMLNDNLDLKTASARIVQARAQLTAANAGLFPSFSASGSDQRYRVPNSVRELPQQAAGSVSPAAGSAVGATGFELPGYVSLYQAGFDATWELDIWGGTRRSVESADASVQAAYAARRGAVVAALAELGVDYEGLRSTQTRIEIANHTLNIEQNLLALTQNRQQNGLASDLDVAQARAQIDNTRAQLPPLQSQALQRIHAIAILLGQLPASLEQELGVPAKVLDSPPLIPIGLPSSLLLNRPDVQQADRMFAAANAQIGVAEAQRLPTLKLTGSTGYTSTALDKLLNQGAWTWDTGASLTAPIFDFGQLQANQRAAEAAARQQALQYQKTVLRAFQDVEDSLQSYAAAMRQQDALSAALGSAQLTETRSLEQYKAGLASYINVLDADRTLASAQDQLAQSEQSRVQALVSVYKALGGGWQSGEAQLSSQMSLANTNGDATQSPINDALP